MFAFATIWFFFPSIFFPFSIGNKYNFPVESEIHPKLALEALKEGYNEYITNFSKEMNQDIDKTDEKRKIPVVFLVYTIITWTIWLFILISVPPILPVDHWFSISGLVNIIFWEIGLYVVIYDQTDEYFRIMQGKRELFYNYLRNELNLEFETKFFQYREPDYDEDEDDPSLTRSYQEIIPNTGNSDSEQKREITHLFNVAKNVGNNLIGYNMPFTNNVSMFLIFFFFNLTTAWYRFDINILYFIPFIMFIYFLSFKTLQTYIEHKKINRMVCAILNMDDHFKPYEMTGN